MLDENTTETVAADDLPRPPAGRRATRRPAGPPVVTVEATPAAAPKTRAAGSDEVAPIVVGTEASMKKPTRRRATRPAGATPTTPVAEPASAVAEPVEAAAPKTTRRRATRKTAAPDVAAEPTAEVAESSSPVAEPVEAPAPKTTRRRATRKTAAPDTVAEPTAEVAEPVEAAAPKTTRRRSTRKAAAPATVTEPVDAEAADATDVAEKVEELKQTTGARRRKVASPFAPPTVLSPVETEAMLAELAQKIAGQADDALEPDETEESDATEVTLEQVDQIAVEGDVQLQAEVAEDEAAEGDAGGDDQEASDASTDEDDDEQPRRRRRRRGGRRRRRGASSESSDSEDDAEKSDEDRESGDEQTEAGEGSEDAAESENGEAADPTRRRRRRRRRRGEDTGADEDIDAEVVVRVREPRRAKASDEVTGIDGSTRLEAKRQRRREGRAAGRRRTPILSEAEFLSRRESVDRTMAIRQSEDYTEIAVLEDNVLVEHYVDRKTSQSMIGNIYLGRVQNVLPSMEAAFIDIGRGRNAVLYAGEVDWDAYLTNGEPRKMEAAFKSGQTVLVQVTKDPVGAKGARLTSHISIPGRYIVYSPSGELSGISRKLPDTERQRLKGILDGLIDSEASVIVRTAAEGVQEEELTRDVNRLTAQWEAIQKKVKQGSAPALLYSEPDATVRIVRDLFTEDFSRLVVSGHGGPDDAYETIEAYVTHVAPHLADRLQRHDDTHGDVFSNYRVDEQIAKALERKVFLPSGGSLVIDRTEAMTVIDVNTGKFTGTGGNLEATVTSNNLEAAEEIVRQLRLRDIGGIIVIDFIDMVLPSNRELLLRRLVECLGRDRTRHQVSEVTSLGLVQLTRKKIGTGLAEAFTVECETCKGRGYHVHNRPVATQAPADGGDRSERRAANRRKKADKPAGEKVTQMKAKRAKNSEATAEAAPAEPTTPSEPESV